MGIYPTHPGLKPGPQARAGLGSCPGTVSGGSSRHSHPRCRRSHTSGSRMPPLSGSPSRCGHRCGTADWCRPVVHARIEQSARMSPNFFLLPLRPDPTSVTSRFTGRPLAEAKSRSRCICLSKSSFWSWEETRAYRAAAGATCDGSGSWTSIVPVANCYTGRGTCRNGRDGRRSCNQDHSSVPSLKVS
jgi:hypothetical protein